ncbi:hypothetical protein HDU83_004174 [Entophlyctis luteolus]|nr:hypothetical protein HDU83_004174 [Entophlyctis luteolus]
MSLEYLERLNANANAYVVQPVEIGGDREAIWTPQNGLVGLGLSIGNENMHSTRVPAAAAEMGPGSRSVDIDPDLIMLGKGRTY